MKRKFKSRKIVFLERLIVFTSIILVSSCGYLYYIYHSPGITFTKRSLKYYFLIENPLLVNFPLKKEYTDVEFYFSAADTVKPEEQRIEFSTGSDLKMLEADILSVFERFGFSIKKFNLSANHHLFLARYFREDGFSYSVDVSKGVNDEISATISVFKK